MDEWTSNEELNQTSNECVEPEMAAMAQADMVWAEMEWDKMERQETGRRNMDAAKAQAPAEGGPPCKARCAGPSLCGILSSILPEQR